MKIAKNDASWRGRIGVIVPVSNSTNEIEFNRMKPDGVSVHFTRVPLDYNPSQDNFETMLKNVDRASKDLLAVNVDVIAYGCTSGSMSCPHNRLIERMETASSKPSISTAGAILESLEQLNVKNVAMATPYSEKTNEKEQAFMERHGIKVTSIKGLNLSGTLEKIQKISRVSPKEVFEHAKSVNSDEAEAVLICCTDFGAAEIIKPLEDTIQKPVITSNSATFRCALRKAGIKTSIENFGQLMQL